MSMRRARIAFEGSYHHVMNRGIEGKAIFPDDKSKDYFLKLLKEKRKKLKIRLLAYCLMDNHYHLILQNSSGKLSGFMKQLNGHYGIAYRKREGERGYVFQGRYKSTLIQEGPYLRMSIIYVLLNPIRAGIVDDPFDYKWSSLNEYFVNDNDSIVDKDFVLDIMQSKEMFEGLLKEWSGKELPVMRTRFGPIIGGEDFKEESLKKYNRRKGEGKSKRMRKDDYIFKPSNIVIEGFEKGKGVKISEINTNTLKGKKSRAELLVLLKDKAGLTYKEVIEYPLFRQLKYSSLGHLYQRAKIKMKGD
jgi:REP element-mobilizing transposase RayT